MTKTQNRVLWLTYVGVLLLLAVRLAELLT